MTQKNDTHNIGTKDGKLGGLGRSNQEFDASGAGTKAEFTSERTPGEFIITWYRDNLLLCVALTCTYFPSESFYVF